MKKEKGQRSSLGKMQISDRCRWGSHSNSSNNGMPSGGSNLAMGYVNELQMYLLGVRRVQTGSCELRTEAGLSVVHLPARESLLILRALAEDVDG